jgi:hypothetical protein
VYATIGFFDGSTEIYDLLSEANYPMMVALAGALPGGT